MKKGRRVCFSGVQVVKQPAEPGKRVYPARRKICDGKGRAKKAKK
jgi:hypothetical protein